MSEEFDILPEVAKNIFVMCKKCEKDRYHKVLAHKTEKSARIQCEVCKSIKSFTIKKKKKAAAKKTTGTRTRKKSLSSRWADVVLRLEKETPEKYSIKGKFSDEVLIQHPKFGEGLVLESLSDRIIVLFSEGEKTLMHNRQ